MHKVLLGITLLLFGILTGFALWHHGYTGVILYQMQTFAGQQVFTDLSIALALISIWLFQDAKKINRNPWGWIFLTFFLGSFGPLMYLITRPSQIKS